MPIETFGIGKSLRKLVFITYNRYLISFFIKALKGKYGYPHFIGKGSETQMLNNWPEATRLEVVGGQLKSVSLSSKPMFYYFILLLKGNEVLIITKKWHLKEEI